MSEVVLGKDIALYIVEEVAGTPTPTALVCGTSFELTEDAEMIEITTASSGAWREFEPQYQSWRISFEGIMNYDTTLGYSENSLTQYKRDLTKLSVRVLKSSIDGTDVIEEGECYISNVTQTGQKDGAATFSVQLQGTGELVQS